MKKHIPSIIISFLFLASVAHAQFPGAFGPIFYWDGNDFRPVDDTVGLIIPGIASSTSGLLEIQSNGYITPTSTPSVSSFTITGLGKNMILTSNGSGGIIASSSPTASHYLATSTTPSHFGTSCITPGGGGGNLGFQGIEICGSDNTVSGVQSGITNISAGTSAYNGLYFNNDVADAAITKFGFIGLNSSTYTDTTFGTGIANKSQLTVQNSIANLSLLSSTSTAASSFINFFTGGSAIANERMRITSDGLVGIGTTTPVQKLEVTDGVLRLSNGEAGSNAYYVDLESNYSSANSFNLEFNDVPFLQYDNTANTPVTIGRATGNVIVPWVLGIGTTTLNNMLDIYSTTKAAIGFSGASGNTNKWTIGYDVTNGKFAIASSTALGTSNRFVIDGNGNVGIGSSNPTSPLSVTASSSSSMVSIINTATSLGGGYNGGLSITGDTAATAINAFQNSGVGIVIRNANATAGVYGGIYFQDAGYNGVAGMVSYSLNDANNEGALGFVTRPSGGSVAERIRISSGGNVGIGTTTPTTNLQVNGTTATSTISATVVSGSTRSTTLGGKIILQDMTGGTCTEITTQAGIITSKAVTCP